MLFSLQSKVFLLCVGVKLCLDVRAPERRHLVDSPGPSLHEAVVHVDHVSTPFQVLGCILSRGRRAEGIHFCGQLCDLHAELSDGLEHVGVRRLPFSDQDSELS